MKTIQEKLKRRIVLTVQRSGTPILTQTIADRIAIPEDIMLNDLLSELTMEGRLTRRYTLLVNGDKGYTYNLVD